MCFSSSHDAQKQAWAGETSRTPSHKAFRPIPNRLTLLAAHDVGRGQTHTRRETWMLTSPARHRMMEVRVYVHHPIYSPGVLFGFILSPPSGTEGGHLKKEKAILWLEMRLGTEALGVYRKWEGRREKGRKAIRPPPASVPIVTLVLCFFL